MNGDQLRADIDGGRTGDKVSFADPAAVPLGTDAEAGGSATAFPSERRRVDSHSGRSWGGLAVYIGVMTGIGLFVIGLALATT